MHYPGHNFTGPGTDVHGRIRLGIRPTNKVDAGSMQHDLDYGIIKDTWSAGRINDEEAADWVRKADLKLVRHVEALKGRDIPDDGSQRAVSIAMRSKMLSEDLGLLNPLMFMKGLDSNETVFKKQV